MRIPLNRPLPGAVAAQQRATVVVTPCSDKIPRHNSEPKGRNLSLVSLFSSYHANGCRCPGQATMDAQSTHDGIEPDENARQQLFFELRQ